jgi:hypothetical protein
VVRFIVLLLFAAVGAACLDPDEGVDAAENARRIDMGDADQKQVAVALKLEKQVVVRGESSYFSVTIKNVTKATIRDALALTKHNEALNIEVRSGDNVHVATQRSKDLREGLYSHGPRAAATVDIPPEEKLSLSGDLLSWFGELKPGQYQVTATYGGADVPGTSEPVELRVLKADPVSNDVPRYGLAIASAPLAAAWTHKYGSDSSDAGKFGVFYQLQSQCHPGSPVHGLLAAVLKAPVEPRAAVTPVPGLAVGHVVWQDGRKLAVAPVDVEKQKLGTSLSLSVPFRGSPAPSPLTMRDGTLHIPYVEKDGKSAALLTVDAEGKSSTTEVPVGGYAPIGQSAWVWLNDARLTFVWAKPRGREIMSTWIPLGDLEAGFSTPIFVNVNDPVIYMHGYGDQDSANARRLPDNPMPAPDAIVWILQETAGGVAVARANMMAASPQVAWSFEKPEDSAFEVLSSVVTHQKNFAFVLQATSGQLLYASTTTKSIRPLAELMGGPIRREQSPALIAAGKDGILPFVHVRYIDSEGGRLAYAKIEPEGKHDPMDGPRRPDAGPSTGE